MRLPACSALLALPLLACACAPAAGPSRDLALRHVVLYQNGVGYFERAGVLREDRLRLRLREREMDDVLKTLVVVEQKKGGGGKPSTVTALLPQAKKGALAKDPEESTWLDVVLSPRPSDELSIAYAVPTAAWKSAYRVVLPDVKEKPAEGQAPAETPAAGSGKQQALLQAWALVDNVSDEDWTDIQLSLATGAPFTFTTHLRDVRFVDRPEVNLDRLRGLEGTATGPVVAERSRGADRDGDGIPDAEDACPNEPGAPDYDPKRNGCPRRQLVVMTEKEIQILQQVHFDQDSSVLKPAARPILDATVEVLRNHQEIHLRIEGHAALKERTPYEISALRARAVMKYLIEHGIAASRLTIAGFGIDRPLAPNDTDQNRALNRRVQFVRAESAPPAPVAPPADKPAEPPPVADMEKMARSAAPSAALKAAPGTLRYDITHPVTLPRQSTTMVTIVNEYVPGEDILLFRPDGNVSGSDLHPFHAARIENKSGYGLQAGPVAIFGGGTFVGEGLIDALGRNQTAFIPYGLDADASVRLTPSTVRTPVRIVAVAKGMLLVEDQLVLTTRYHLTVGDRPPARLFLRHPRAGGYEPDKPGPDTEMTEEALLVPVPIGSGWQGDVSILERRNVRERIPILGTEAARLVAYLAGSKLPAAAEKKLREMVQLRGEEDRLGHEIDSLRARLSDLAGRAAELRESLKTIEKTPRAAALQQKLLERLGEATKESEELSRKLSDDGASLNEARARLADGLRELVIEEEVAPAKP